MTKHLPKIVVTVPIIIWTLFGFINDNLNPEEIIIGNWKEAHWEYALKSGTSHDDDSISNSVIKEVYELMGKDFKIHNSENWNFMPDGKLEISKKDGSKLVAEWRIKGRGHILAIKYPDYSKEIYDIKELTSNELILNFDIGMELRGIAKLSFKKEKNKLK